VVADVDGTLLTGDKRLTERTIAAVHRLRAFGIPFMVTSSRPPMGLRMLVEPLDLTTPLAAFNGGLFVDTRMNVVERIPIPDPVVAPICGLLASTGVDVWAYTESDWLVTDPSLPRVRHEARVLGFGPSGLLAASPLGGVVKLVGVHDDEAVVERARSAVVGRFGSTVSASRSQPYYLDITHPHAHKGNVVLWFARRLGVKPGSIATIGDMPNDVRMFQASGLGIAMGNAERWVRDRADLVTAPNDSDGFAEAMEHFVLGSAPVAALSVAQRS